MKFEYEGYVLKIKEVEADKDIRKYYQADCRELPYIPSTDFETSLFFILDEFMFQVRSYMLKEKEMTEDKEVQLVNQFISDLNQVLDEMEVIEKNIYYEVVLEAKLMKLMKAYGDSLCLGNSINVYRNHYNYVAKQREDKKKPKMSILDSDRNTITISYKIREDGYIECEPFTNDVTIVGFKLNV